MRCLALLLLVAAPTACASLVEPLAPEPAVSAVVTYAEYHDACPVCEDRDVARDQCRLSAVSPSFHPDAVDGPRLKCFYTCAAGHSWAVTR